MLALSWNGKGMRSWARGLVVSAGVMDKLSGGLGLGLSLRMKCERRAAIPIEFFISQLANNPTNERTNKQETV